MANLADSDGLYHSVAPGASESIRVLGEFLNEQWRKELGMQAEINTVHPDAEMDRYHLHEANMRRIEQIFNVLFQSEEYRKALDLVKSWLHRPLCEEYPEAWPEENGKHLTITEIIDHALRA